MPGGPLVYIAKKPHPGFILLQRWTFNFGPTEHRDVVARDRARAPDPDARSDRSFPLEPEPIVEGLGAPQVPNPYGGQSGWILRGAGKAAYKDHGLVGDDGATLRFWYVRVPNSDRITLFPKQGLNTRKWGLPAGDPLRAAGRLAGRWVSDEYITTLVAYAARGLPPKVPPLNFAVLPTQGDRSAKEPGPDLAPPTAFSPIQALYELFSTGVKQELQAPKGLSLLDAATALGFGGSKPAGMSKEEARRWRQKVLTSPLNSSPALLFEMWRRRSERATANQRLILNEAYHRILVAKFLKLGKRGKPRLTPPTKGNKRLDAEIEARANLIQAYRVFVFDRNGCPVGLNQAFIETMGIRINTLRDRNVPYARYLRGGLAKKWTAWLYAEVLNKSPQECTSGVVLSGLEELLVAVNGLG